MHNSTIDINSLIYSKNKSSKNWKKHNFLHVKISDLVGKKIFELSHKFKNLLVLSSDMGEVMKNVTKMDFEKLIFLSPYKNLLKEININEKRISKVEGNFENLPFSENKFDLIISNLCLHNINDKESHLNKIYNLLTKDGFLICNFFGENCLKELRNCLFAADEEIFKGIFLRLAPNLKMVDVSDLFSTSGFKEIVSEKITYKIYYSNAFNILKDIKGIGENSFLLNRKKSLMTNNYLKKLDFIYKKRFGSSHGLEVSCDIVSIIGWKNTL